MNRRSMLWTLATGLLFSPAGSAEVLQTPAGAIAYTVGGDGCPLVLVGGATDSPQRAAAGELLSERFQTIAVDLRGTGRSEAPTAAYSDADDLVAVLDHLGLEAALFAGASAAGATVIEVALAHPQRVIGGVAINPSVAGLEPAPETAERPAAGKSLARRPQPPVLERLGEIVPPLLLVAGALDPPDAGHRLDLLETKIAGVQRVLVPDAGDSVATENPQGFVDAVLPFLHGLGCRVWPPPRAAARAELIALHRDAIRFHLERDVDSWLARERDVMLIAAGGELHFPTAGERREMRQDYLGSTEFSVYRDLRPAVVRLADDLSQGWLLAEVEIQGVEKTPDGDTPFSWQWAWIELFERAADGAWVWVGNVSNSRP